MRIFLFQVTGGSVYAFVSMVVMMWLIVVSADGHGQSGWLPAGCWMLVAIVQLVLALPIRQVVVSKSFQYFNSASLCL